MHYEHHRDARDEYHRCEILERIVRQRLVQMRIDRERRAGREQHRIAIGRRLRDVLRAYQRRRPTAVLDDYRLSHAARCRLGTRASILEHAAVG